MYIASHGSLYGNKIGWDCSNCLFPRSTKESKIVFIEKVQIFVFPLFPYVPLYFSCSPCVSLVPLFPHVSLISCIEETFGGLGIVLVPQAAPTERSVSCHEKISVCGLRTRIFSVYVLNSTQVQASPSQEGQVV